jgi:hypothetical protein
MFFKVSVIFCPFLLIMCYGVFLLLQLRPEKVYAESYRGILD